MAWYLVKHRDNFNFTDHREVQWEAVDCMNLDQDRELWRAVVNAVMNLLVS
jgi:hypothetical protein